MKKSILWRRELAVLLSVFAFVTSNSDIAAAGAMEAKVKVTAFAMSKMERSRTYALALADSVIQGSTGEHECDCRASGFIFASDTLGKNTNDSIAWVKSFCQGSDLDAKLEIFKKATIDFGMTETNAQTLVDDMIARVNYKVRLTLYGAVYGIVMRVLIPQYDVNNNPGSTDESKFANSIAKEFSFHENNLNASAYPTWMLGKLINLEIGLLTTWYDEIGIKFDAESPLIEDETFRETIQQVSKVANMLTTADQFQTYSDTRRLLGWMEFENTKRRIEINTAVALHPAPEAYDEFYKIFDEMRESHPPISLVDSAEVALSILLEFNPSK